MFASPRQKIIASSAPKIQINCYSHLNKKDKNAGTTCSKESIYWRNCREHAMEEGSQPFLVLWQASFCSFCDYSSLTKSQDINHISCS